MLHKTAKNKWSLICDICKKEVTTNKDNFNDTVAYKNENGWINEKHKGEWQDICPECQEGQHESTKKIYKTYRR